MIKLGLLGRQISYSKSRDIHSLSALWQGRRWTYEIINTLEHDLEHTLWELWVKGYHGLNITSPYKETIARMIGAKAPAINTLYRGQTFWEGMSTDGLGFHKAYGSYLEQAYQQSQGVGIILGAGGVFFDLYAYLKEVSSELHVLKRTQSLSKPLIGLTKNHQGTYFHAMHDQSLIEVMAIKDIAWILQATSAPHSRSEIELHIPKHLTLVPLVIDLCYNPPWQALRNAQRLSYFDGYPMLIFQALYSEWQWGLLESEDMEPAYSFIKHQLKR